MARHTGGWVKFWRKAALGDINSNFTRGGLFGALISMANIQESTVSWDGEPRKLVRGQVCTSLRELADLGGVDSKTVSRHLSYLSKRGTVKVEKCSTGTIITFVNYEEYAGLDATGSTQAPRHADNHVHAIGIHNEELKNKRTKEVRDAAEPLHPLIICWNANCGELPKVKKSNKARDRKASERWKENTEEEWAEIIARVSKSAFCNGSNDRGWKATFDWLLQPETHLKISEGKYDGKDGGVDWGAIFGGKNSDRSVG